MERNSAFSHAVRIPSGGSTAFKLIGGCRNVPGVALYMTSLTQLRTIMARSPYFALANKDPFAQGGHSSVLPKLSLHGNLISGATARVGVGFLLNPVTVLKARFEVSTISGSTYFGC